MTGRAPRLDFLDGIRGIASFMVLLLHLQTFAPVPAAVAWLGFGNPWVAIFIVLSAFCLYLPSARAEKPRVGRPFFEFLVRRAVRIVPAWYAALALAIGIGLIFK